MPAYEIMSDGAGSPMNTPLTPDEEAQLRRMFGIGSPVGSAYETRPSAQELEDAPALEPIPNSAGIMLQAPGADYRRSVENVERLRAGAGGVPTLDPDLAVLEMYGLDPQELLGGPVGYDPSRFETPLPEETLGLLPAVEGAQGPEMLDAAVAHTVPGSAPQPPGYVPDGADDPFAFRVQQAHQGLNTPENQRRFFDIASKESTETIMRAVETGDLDTATALAILNVRARLQDVEREIRAEDAARKRPARAPRSARNEALWRIFASEEAQAPQGRQPMNPSPYVQE